MNNIESQTASHFIGRRFFVRQEDNGITVYDKLNHIFDFYEGLSVADVSDFSSEEDTVPFMHYLSQQQNRRTCNVRSRYPFYIGWQLSGRCNLDCIYCFAENKIHHPDSADIMDTAREILKLHPVSVGLSGGEPTLNPRLGEIIKLFKGKTNCVLNTNGTTAQLEKLIPILREADVFVRLTIDSTDNDLLNQVRPPVKMPKNGYDQIAKIRKNVSLLVQNDIPFLIHTVVTSKNLPTLEKTGSDLAAMGVKRWHFYSVSFSEKCRAFYDDIKVSSEQMFENHERLSAIFKRKLLDFRN